MTNADGLGELKNLLLRYVGITGQIHPEIPKIHYHNLWRPWCC